MAGKKVQNAQKTKDKNIKELFEEVKSLREDNEMLKRQVQELHGDLKELDEKFHSRPMALTEKETNNPKVGEFKCEQCDVTFTSSATLKEHRVGKHSQKMICEHCEETFHEIWKLEKHLRTHNKLPKFKCDKCSKEFYIEWRLKKHQEMHLNINLKKCHYFNNSKTCPFEEVGCKFAHEASKKCHFLDKCKNHLCQFQHGISTAKEDTKAEEGTAIVENEAISDPKPVDQAQGISNLDMKENIEKLKQAEERLKKYSATIMVLLEENKKLKLAE